MSALRLSHFLAGATISLVVALVPARVAAQGCTARTCTAVNYVQVTVPRRLGLTAAPTATVRANTSWRLEVRVGETSPPLGAAGAATAYVQLRDNPSRSGAAVRYTLVGS